MIKLWRPRDTDWGNRWPAEEELNRLVAEGWRIIGTFPPCDYTPHPTVLLQNRARWRDPHLIHGWAAVRLYVWWRWHQFTRWVGSLGGTPE